MFAFARPMQRREYCDECMRSRVDWQTTRSSLDTDTSRAVEETSLIGQKKRQKSTDRKTSNYYSWLGHRHDDHGIHGRHCCFLTAGGSEQIGGHTCHLRSSLLLPFTGSASGMRQRGMAGNARPSCGSTASIAALCSRQSPIRTHARLISPVEAFTRLSSQRTLG